MEDLNGCQCCGWQRSDFNISFKPESEVFKIGLCTRCFNDFHISAEFLAAVLQHGRAGDYSRFKEIIDDPEQADAA